MDEQQVERLNGVDKPQLIELISDLSARIERAEVLILQLTRNNLDQDTCDEMIEDHFDFGAVEDDSLARRSSRYKKIIAQCL